MKKTKHVTKKHVSTKRTATPKVVTKTPAKAKTPAKVVAKPKSVKAPAPTKGAAFTIIARDWRAGFTRTAKTRGAGSTMPILGHWLVETVGPKAVRFTTTTLEMASWTTVPANVVDQTARVCLHGTSGALAQYWAGETMQVSVSRLAKVLLTGERQTVTILGYQADEFPVMPKLDVTHTLNLKRALLTEIAGRVSHAASTDDARPVLAGVLLKYCDGKLTVAAADGFRLAVLTKVTSVNRPVPDTATSEKQFDIIVPATFFDIALSALPVTEDDLTLTIGTVKGAIPVKDEPVAISVRLSSDHGKHGCTCWSIPGTFPDYTKIISKTTSTAVFSARELLAAVAYGGIYAKESLNTVTLTLNGSECTVSAESTMSGSISTVIPLAKKSDVFSTPISIAFNRPWLSQAIRNTIVGSEEEKSTVRMKVTSGTAPVQFVDGATYTHVLMPMHGSAAASVTAKAFATEAENAAHLTKDPTAAGAEAYVDEDDLSLTEASESFVTLHEQAEYEAVTD